MGWFQKFTAKLFGKDPDDGLENAWEGEEAVHQIDYNDKEQRDDYVKNCLERMADATREHWRI